MPMHLKEYELQAIEFAFTNRVKVLFGVYVTGLTIANGDFDKEVEAGQRFEKGLRLAERAYLYCKDMILED